MRRRECLTALTALPVAATLARPVRAETLLSQADAAYQDTPKGLQMCGTCTLFLRPAACKLVAGPVARTGWCKLYDMAD